MTEEHEAPRGRPWLRAWLVVGLAAWAQVGVDLVDWAQRRGLVEDISFSPYHLVGYAALLTLAVYVVWTFFHALRRGDWQRAFPPLYGGLGVALMLLVGWVILDMVWRSTLGINPNIEGGIAPPRLLIPAALVLLAVGPVREAIADRARPGISTGERRVRWAGVVGAGLVGGALTIAVFNPVRDPHNDLSFHAGVDASEIWTMAQDGSQQTRLLAALGDGVDYSLPAWSPDGMRIAYTLWRNTDGSPKNVRNEDQTSEIWTMAADGSDRRAVPIPKGGQAWIPAWSPDGQWLAYTLSPLGPAAPVIEPEPNAAPGKVGPPSSSAGASIWIVHPDGTGNQRVTPEGVDALNLVWSPDGTRVAFAVAADGSNTDIHVATLTGAALSNERAIAADPANDWGPAWDPSGASVVFTSDRSGNDEIWIAELGGSEQVVAQMTNDAGADWVPVFSPDGSRIAFTSDRSGDPEVWSMAADGSDARNLTDHPQHYDGQWSVGWSSDGKRIVYATGSYGDPATSGWVLEDLAVAQALLFGVALAIVALLLVALGAPFGSFTLVLTIIIALGALPTEAWRFLPGAVVAGLATDALVRAVRLRHRARVAAAVLPALGNLAVALTIGYGGSLAWSITLVLGVSVASAALGWGLAEAVERLLSRLVTPVEAPAA